VIEPAALHERLLEPLVLGGRLRPVALIGRRAAQLQLQADAAVERARLYGARTLCAIDHLPPFSMAELQLLCVLNDLLQVPNSSLDTPWARNRALTVLDWIDEALASVPPAPTVLDALSRHSTFMRLPELTRVDTEVRWWTGEQRFIGAAPPRRLVALPRVRRVRSHERRLGFGEMAPLDVAWRSRWLSSAAELIAASPLTNIASAARQTPQFAWCPATLSLIETSLGRTLAFRAILRQADVASAAQKLTSSALDLRRDSGAGAAEAAEFARELTQIEALFRNSAART
jgi:hypothetical protein